MSKVSLSISYIQQGQRTHDFNEFERNLNAYKSFILKLVSEPCTMYNYLPLSLEAYMVYVFLRKMTAALIAFQAQSTCFWILSFSKSLNADKFQGEFGVSTFHSSISWR
jgi:hypothetical protein